MPSTSDAMIRKQRRGLRTDTAANPYFTTMYAILSGAAAAVPPSYAAPPDGEAQGQRDTLLVARSNQNVLAKTNGSGCSISPTTRQPTLFGRHNPLRCSRLLY